MSDLIRLAGLIKLADDGGIVGGELHPRPNHTPTPRPAPPLPVAVPVTAPPAPSADPIPEERSDRLDLAETIPDESDAVIRRTLEQVPGLEGESEAATANRNDVQRRNSSIGIGAPDPEATQRYYDAMAHDPNEDGPLLNPGELRDLDGGDFNRPTRPQGGLISLPWAASHGGQEMTRQDLLDYDQKLLTHDRNGPDVAGGYYDPRTGMDDLEYPIDPNADWFANRGGWDDATGGERPWDERKPDPRHFQEDGTKVYHHGDFGYTGNNGEQNKWRPRDLRGGQLALTNDTPTNGDTMNVSNGNSYPPPAPGGFVRGDTQSRNNRRRNNRGNRRRGGIKQVRNDGIKGHWLQQYNRPLDPEPLDPEPYAPEPPEEARAPTERLREMLRDKDPIQTASSSVETDRLLKSDDPIPNPAFVPPFDPSAVSQPPQRSRAETLALADSRNLMLSPDGKSWVHKEDPEFSQILDQAESGPATTQNRAVTDTGVVSPIGYDTAQEQSYFEDMSRKGIPFDESGPLELPEALPEPPPPQQFTEPPPQLTQDEQYEKDLAEANQAEIRAQQFRDQVSQFTKLTDRAVDATSSIEVDNLGTGSPAPQATTDAGNQIAQSQLVGKDRNESSIFPLDETSVASMQDAAVEAGWMSKDDMEAARQRNDRAERMKQLGERLKTFNESNSSIDPTVIGQQIKDLNLEGATN